MVRESPDCRLAEMVSRPQRLRVVADPAAVAVVPVADRAADPAVVAAGPVEVVQVVAEADEDPVAVAPAVEDAAVAAVVADPVDAGVDPMRWPSATGVRRSAISTTAT